MHPNQTPLMHISGQDKYPLWAWRLSLAAICLSLALTIFLLLMTLSGLTDPAPMGHLVIDDRFTQPLSWNVNEVTHPERVIFQAVPGGYEIEVHDLEQQVTVSSSYSVTALPASVQLDLAQVDGPSDAGYGLWLADSSKSSNILIGVNGDGYLGIFDTVVSSVSAIRPWGIFPHVKALGEDNAIRADIMPDSVKVWLNEEVVTTFRWVAPDHLTPGVFVAPTASAPVRIKLLRLRIWQQSQSNNN